MARAPRGGWLRLGGLFSKFVVSFVGLVVLVLVVNGAVETWFLYRETKTELVGVESERAVTTALRIDQSLSDVERHISWVTRASVVALEILVVPLAGQDEVLGALVVQSKSERGIDIKYD